jgi:hypothetical protein
MDNDSAFRGFTNRKQRVGRLIRWLCSLGIIPLFNAPNSPWNNGSVEGGNSVFDKKFWRNFHFKNLEEVNQKLKEFNRDYESYLLPDWQSIDQSDLPELTDPLKLKVKETKSIVQSKVYFLRRVREKFEKYQVEVLNIYINLAEKYVGQYVFIELDIVAQSVKIYQEIEGKQIVRYQSTFYVLN